MDPSVASEFAQTKLVRFLLDQLTLQSMPYDSLLDSVRILTGLGRTEKGQQVRRYNKTLEAQYLRSV